MKLAGHQFKQIMSGKDGSMYALDGKKGRNGYGVWKYSFKEEDWKQINGRAYFLAIGYNGMPYAISGAGNVFWPPEPCLQPTRIAKPKTHVPKVFEPCRSFRRVIWQKQGGKANDIGVGSNGAIWALGEKTEGSEDFEIKRWTGQSWEVQEEVAHRIAVDSKGNPWVVKKEGNILKYVEGNFVEMPGKARDIGIGANGEIFTIGWDRQKKGYEVNKWVGGKWLKTSGYGFRVAVDRDGEPWVVTRRHKVFRKIGKKWERVRGQLDDIGIGPEGSIIGVRRRRGVWKYNLDKKKWYKIGKFAASVAVGPGGRPYITTSREQIFWAEPECPDLSSTIRAKIPAAGDNLLTDNEESNNKEFLPENTESIEDLFSE